LNVRWTPRAEEDYAHWVKTNQEVLGKINELIKHIQRNPFKGPGKPEPLKHSLRGQWSRRITGEHRLVYRVTGKDDSQQVEILQCRYHY
jgi:toxin YoeB